MRFLFLCHGLEVTGVISTAPSSVVVELELDLCSSCSDATALVSSWESGTAGFDVTASSW